MENVKKQFNQFETELTKFKAFEAKKVTLCKELELSENDFDNLIDKKRLSLKQAKIDFLKAFDRLLESEKIGKHEKKA